MESAAIISTVMTVAVQLVLTATMFNPAWSPPNTWPGSDGQVPPVDVTQAAHREYSFLTQSVTGGLTIAGTLLGPVVADYIDEWRGTKSQAENDRRAGKKLNDIDKRIGDLQLEDSPRKKALEALRKQLLRAEALAGVTERTKEMHEQIEEMRLLVDSPGSSRRSSTSSSSTQSSVRRRNNLAPKRSNSTIVWV